MKKPLTLITGMLIGVSSLFAPITPAVATSSLVFTSLGATPMTSFEAGLAPGPGSSVYLAGGTGPSGDTSSNFYSYAPATSTWTTLPQMPTPRYFYGALSDSAGNFYAVGGYCSTSNSMADCNGANTLSAVDEYVASKGQWQSLPQLPSPRMAQGAVMGQDGRIYAMGGQDDSGHVVADILIYDPTTSTWSQGAPMPHAREAFGITVASDGKIFAIGGGSGFGVISSVDILVCRYI